MAKVDEIFEAGPRVVIDWISRNEHAPDLIEMDVKLLADMCWTRASSNAQTEPEIAREWGKAALAGYEMLSRHATPFVAESAEENAAALRAWPLLHEDAATTP